MLLVLSVWIFSSVFDFLLFYNRSSKFSSKLSHGWLLLSDITAAALDDLESVSPTHVWSNVSSSVIVTATADAFFDGLRVLPRLFPVLIFS